MAALKIGLCGLGTVGSTVFSLLSRHENSRRWQSLGGRPLSLVHLGARNLHGYSPGNIRHSTDLMKVAEDPEIDVLVELIGGSDFARHLVEAALRNGKQVVTANKELFSRYGSSLLAIAAETGAGIHWEAAVGGGIPVVRTLQEGLAANTFSRIAGILNGTSNYVITAMQQQGSSFAEAVSSAQELGYAEADPSLDVNGSDAAHKLHILAAQAWGVSLDSYGRAIYREGIEQLKPVDFDMARIFGYCIKPLAIAEINPNGKAVLRVHPSLVPLSHLLSGVNGPQNAVLTCGHIVGETILCGPGAGGNPTASAVMSDLLAISRGHAAPTVKASSCLLSGDIQSVSCSHYLRINLLNKPGVISQVTRILAEERINVELFHQQKLPEDSAVVSASLITGTVREGKIQRVLSQLTDQVFVRGGIMRLRIEDFSGQANT